VPNDKDHGTPGASNLNGAALRSVGGHAVADAAQQSRGVKFDAEGGPVYRLVGLFSVCYFL